jgi:hypothetical protein
MSTSARHGLYYIPEVTYGVTPAATPAFVNLRHTGTTLGISKSTHVSEELRADRQIPDFRHGTKQAAGDISFELSYGTFDAWLEAALGGTWTTNVLKAGTVRRSFSVLRQFGDITAGAKGFHLFTGLEVGSFKLTVPTDGIVKGSFACTGKGSGLAITAPTGATLGSATTTRVFDAFTGAVTEGGTASGIVTEITLSVDNGLNPKFAIGSDTVISEATIGRSNVTGQATVYFQNETMLEKFLNETASSLTFSLVSKDTSPNTYLFTLPRIVYNGGQPDTKGQGEIMLSIPFQCLYDSTAGTNIQITRSAGA